MPKTPYRFGPFVLLGEELRFAGTRVNLGGRTLALLRYLLEAEGYVISKADLLALVWPGRQVAEVNLTVQMSHLRKALGKRPNGLDWITTVPGHGYRLERNEEARAAISSLPTLMVMPFRNLTGDDSQLYLVDGFVDEAISALSRFRNFVTQSRTATVAARDGSAQKPDSANWSSYHLEGSVRRVGDALRVVTTLADRAGAILWSQSFQGQASDLLNFQDEVVRGVALTISPRIEAAEFERTRQKTPSSMSAYDMYLQAIFKLGQFQEAANLEALQLLDAALAIEPDNTRYLGQARWGRETRISFGWPLLADDDRDRCLALAERVIELGPEDAGALCRCGLTLQLVGQDYDRGFEVVERALAMNPHDPVVLVYGGITQYLSGDLDRGAMLMRQVIAMQPHHSFEAMGVLACLLAASGQLVEALDWAKRGLAINPHYAPNHWVAVASAAHLGQMAEAKQALSRLLDLTPDLTVQGLLRVRPRDPRRDEVLAEGFRKAGLREV